LLACLAGTGVSVRSQQRDAPQQPTFRQVAVGTSLVVGQIVDAQTGQPVAQARLNLSGMTAFGMALSARPPSAGGSGPGRSGGVSVGMSVTLPSGVSTSLSGGQMTNTSREGITDAQGNFAFRNLPAGKYQLTISHRSYLTGAAGQRKPGGPGRPFEVVDGQKVEVNVKMVRGGVVTGAVYDDNGAPLVNSRVQAWRMMPSANGPRMQAQNSTTTDDRGVYRMHGLQPGTYAVSAQPQTNFENDIALEEAAQIDRAVASGAVQQGTAGQPATVRIPAPAQRTITQPVGFLPTYAPSATSSDAGMRLAVVGGDEHAGIDIHIRQLRASTISGMVTNIPAMQGAPNRVQVTSYSEPFTGTSNGTSVNPDGRFTISNLQPGTYTVVASLMTQSNTPSPPGVAPTGASQPRLTARTTVTVFDDMSVPVTLDLRPGRSVSGHMTIDMTRQQASPQTVTVRVSSAPGEIPAMGNLPVAPVDASGRFTIPDVPPGRYLLSASLPVRSARLGGVELLDSYLDVSGSEDIQGIQVLVSDRSSQLSGLISPGSDYDASEYTVIVVSSDPDHWRPGSRRVVTTRANLAGRYTATLPPGSYVVGLVAEFESGMQNDPEFLKALVASGVPVTIGDGDRTTRDLRAGR
jgi:uncharacterized protein (DUF2141 family)